jgi:hypothetical protein
MLLLLATRIVAWTGNIYAGLYYSIGMALMTGFIGLFSSGKPRTLISHRAHRSRFKPRAERLRGIMGSWPDVSSFHLMVVRAE